jgi:hypothetical protein
MVRRSGCPLLAVAGRGVGRQRLYRAFALLVAIAASGVGSFGCGSPTYACNAPALCDKDPVPSPAVSSACSEQRKDADCAAFQDCVAKRAVCAGATSVLDVPRTLDAIGGDGTCAAAYEAALRKSCVAVVTAPMLVE